MAHKRPIPQVPRSASEHGRVAFDSAVKEDLEVLMGQRGALIKVLPAAATSTLIVAALPAAAPAGGTGAAAGAWDTAANRDAAIATINGLRTMNTELKLDHDALLADVTALTAKVNEIIARLQ